MLGREPDDQIAMDHRRWDRQYDQTAIRLARECDNAALDFFRVPDTNGTYVDTERWRRTLDGAKLTYCGGIRHISQHCRSRDLGRDLFEQLQPFDGHAKFGRGEAGGVAARVRQAIDNTCANRIWNQYEYDRHGACCLLHRSDARWSRCQDDIGCECYDFHRVPAIAIGLTRRPSHVDVHIAADSPARLL